MAWNQAGNRRTRDMATSRAGFVEPVSRVSRVCRGDDLAQPTVRNAPGMRITPFEQVPADPLRMRVPKEASMSNLATVEGIYEAFGKGDVPAILDVLADDVE